MFVWRMCQTPSKGKTKDMLAWQCVYGEILGAPVGKCPRCLRGKLKPKLKNEEYGKPIKKGDVKWACPGYFDEGRQCSLSDSRLIHALLLVASVIAMPVGCCSRWSGALHVATGFSRLRDRCAEVLQQNLLNRRLRGAGGQCHSCDYWKHVWRLADVIHSGLAASMHAECVSNHWSPCVCLCAGSVQGFGRDVRRGHGGVG